MFALSAQTDQGDVPDGMVVTMAYTRQTALGKASYSVRQSTVEPVIGSRKEGLGFRPFSWRGAPVAAGEWCLVCLACTLKRLHPVLQG